VELKTSRRRLAEAGRAATTVGAAVGAFASGSIPHQLRGCALCLARWLVGGQRQRKRPSLTRESVELLDHNCARVGVRRNADPGRHEVELERTSALGQRKLRFERLARMSRL
jgi:hypothetical protein